MSITYPCSSSSYSDKGSVSSTCLDRSLFLKAILLGDGLLEIACDFSALDYPWKVRLLHPLHPAHRTTPLSFSLAGIKEHSSKCAILTHDRLSRQLEDHILLDIQSGITFRESFLFMLFQPFILPHRVFSRGADSTGIVKALC